MRKERRIGHAGRVAPIGFHCKLEQRSRIGGGVCATRFPLGIDISFKPVAPELGKQPPVSQRCQFVDFNSSIRRGAGKLFNPRPTHDYVPRQTDKLIIFGLVDVSVAIQVEPF